MNSALINHRVQHNHWLSPTEQLPSSPYTISESSSSPPPPLIHQCDVCGMQRMLYVWAERANCNAHALPPFNAPERLKAEYEPCNIPLTNSAAVFNVLLLHIHCSCCLILLFLLLLFFCLLNTSCIAARLGLPQSSIVTWTVILQPQEEQAVQPQQVDNRQWRRSNRICPGGTSQRPASLWPPINYYYMQYQGAVHPPSPLDFHIVHLTLDREGTELQTVGI